MSDIENEEEDEFYKEMKENEKNMDDEERKKREKLYLMNDPIRAFEIDNLKLLYSDPFKWLSVVSKDRLFKRMKWSVLDSIRTLGFIWLPLLVGSYLGLQINGPGMANFIELFRKGNFDKIVNTNVNYHPLSNIKIKRATEEYIGSHKTYHEYFKNNYIDGFEAPINDYEVLIAGLRNFLKSQNIDYQEILNTDTTANITIKHTFITYALTMIFYIAMPFIATYRLILGFASGFINNTENNLFSPSHNTPGSGEKPSISSFSLMNPIIAAKEGWKNFKLSMAWILGIAISLFHFGITWGTLYNSLLILTLGFTLFAVFVYHGYNFFTNIYEVTKITAKITFKYLWLMMFFFFAITRSIITLYWKGSNINTFIELLIGVFIVVSAVKYWKDKGELMKKTN